MWNATYRHALTIDWWRELRSGHGGYTSLSTRASCSGLAYSMAIAYSRSLTRHHLGFDDEVEHEDER
jgi:hypothetical protein